jgi:uncharacterized protein (TIGR03435 family)
VKKEVPAYALVVAEGGQRLKPISGDYVESLVMFQGRSSMDRLAYTLNNFLGTDVRVVDKTGLEGAFEYEFEPIAHFTFDNPGGGIPPSAAERAEMLSRRLESILGLRLQAERAIAIDALVIDSVELPSSN